MEQIVQWEGEDGVITTAILTRAIGVSGACPYTIEKEDGTFEARMAISIMGSYNMKQEELERLKYNPFHPKYHDNFAQGLGETKEEAIKAMMEDCDSISNTLWL